MQKLTKQVDNMFIVKTFIFCAGTGNWQKKNKSCGKYFVNMILGCQHSP